jgi:sugar/nucleoside kinase (ribokinase family)
MKKFDVINVADICTDVVIAGREKPSFGQVETLADSYEIELGGSGPIFASQFAKLGGNAAVASVIGTDPLGDFIQHRLEELGIDTTYLLRSSRNKTPLGLNISIEGDRSMLTVLGTLNEITPALVDEIPLERIRHWHIAGYFLLPSLFSFWPDFLRKLKKNRITSSLDTNWSPLGNWQQVKEILPLVDVFLPNDQEAMAIAGTSDYRHAGQMLSENTGMVVIKRGGEGASLFRDGKELSTTVQENWKGEVRVVDTTGAGDSFDGGFIYEWLRGASPEECLKTGIVCGTSSVRGVGGIQSQYHI